MKLARSQWYACRYTQWLQQMIQKFPFFKQLKLPLAFEILA